MRNPSYQRLRVGGRAQRKPSRGAAVVELAVCLPVMVLLVFGAIEATNVVYLKQTATTAAYEGVRLATATGGTESAARQRIDEVLATHAISNATVTFNPSIGPTTRRGDNISVSVTIPASENITAVTRLFGEQSYAATITMVRQ